MTYVTRRTEYQQAVELTVRSFFSQSEAGPKAAQDDLTKRILRFATGQFREQLVLELETLHSEKNISALWFSDDFMMPLFAGMAMRYVELTFPPRSDALQAKIIPNQNAFFGFSLEDIATNSDKIENHLFFLYAAGSTKAVLGSENGLLSAFIFCKDLIDKTK